MVVYPRWRGELTNDAPKPRLLHGLSPLARGTLSPMREARAISRFIPAGAGNSDQSGLYRLARTVYPRWRGELLQLILRERRPRGLSPQARGTQ